MLVSRLYSGEHDLADMLALLAQVRPPARIADYPGPVALREVLSLPEVQANTRLWFDEHGRLAGYALVDAYANLCFEAQACWLPALEPDIVAWGEACIRRSAQEADEPLVLDASCRADDAARAAALERMGFARQAQTSLRYSRPLSAPIPEPQVPAGFTIRPVRGPEEAPAWVALHRAAREGSRYTLEEHLAMLALPGYERELDLVAVAPDGSLAAYCFCSISAEENAQSGRRVGTTDPVATHPRCRRLGLAKALLLTGLRLLRERGMETAGLSTGGDNLPMQRAAASAGFQMTETIVWYTKPLRKEPSHA